MKPKKARKELAQLKDERESVAKELDVALRYWSKSVQPCITERKLHGAELHVAEDAHYHMRSAWKKADEWNASEKGKRMPVPLPDGNKPEFRRPETLFADEVPPREILATIAAAASPTVNHNLSSDAAISRALDLLNAADRRIASLPRKPKTDAKEWATHFAELDSCVTIKEIYDSNQSNSGRLPLLPPTQVKKKGRESSEITGSQKPDAIRVALKRFLKRNAATQPSETEWRREQQALDHLKKGLVSVLNLCAIRWERFKNFSAKQVRHQSNAKKHDCHT